MQLDDFAGAWTIERVITHADGLRVTAQGTAAFAPRAGGLDYSERGQMQIAGATPLTFERRYRFDADLAVYFDDGRFFHTVPSGGGQAHHHCAPDDYDVTYAFNGPDAWSTIWVVTGPKKSYTMQTHYTRLSGSKAQPVSA